jgi:hypothetical protein
MGAGGKKRFEPFARLRRRVRAHNADRVEAETPGLNDECRLQGSRLGQKSRSA